VHDSACNVLMIQLIGRGPIVVKDGMVRLT
jgi:hypothetical protein